MEQQNSGFPQPEKVVFEIVGGLDTYGVATGVVDQGVRIATFDYVLDIESRLLRDFVASKVRLTSPRLRFEGVGRCESHSDVRSTREEREVQQRRAAQKKLRLARKALPKDERLKDKAVKQSQAFNKRVEAPVQEQGLGAVLVKRVVPSVLAGVGGIVSAKVLVDGLAATIQPLLGAVSDSLKGILSNGVKATEQVNVLLKQLTDTFTSFVKSVKAIVGGLWILPMGVLAYWVLGKFVDNEVLRVVIMGALSIAFGKLWPHVADHFSSIGKVEAQAGVHGQENVLKSVILALLTFSYIPRQGSEVFLRVLSSRISMLPRLGDGIESLFKIVVDLAEKAISLIYWATGVKDEDNSTKQFYFGDQVTKAVKTWLKKSYDFMDKLGLKPAPEVVRATHDHVRRGYAMLQTVKDDQLLFLLKRGVDNLETKLAPFMGVVTAGKNFRVEPHFVLFTGLSGVGKSSILVKFVLSALLLSGECKPKDVLANLWQKGSSEYWNGYVNQKCVVMDDVFQKVSAKGDPESEYMDIIRMISNWSYPLNMADLNSKGRFYFDSPLVVGTTNCSNIHETTYKEVVKCPEAVVRRIHDVIYIEAAPDYAKEDGTMDYMKLEAKFKQDIDSLLNTDRDGPILPEHVVDCVPWDAWRAKRVDFTKFTFPARGQSFDDAVDLRQLVVDLALKLKTKREYHQASLDAMDSYASILGVSMAEPQLQSGIERLEAYPEPSCAAQFRTALNSYEDCLAQYQPELEEHKLKLLCAHFKKKNRSYFDYERGQDLRAKFEHVGLWKMLVLGLITALDGSVYTAGVAANENGCAAWLDAFGSKFGQPFFGDISTITLEEVRSRVQFLIDTLGDSFACSRYGINTTSHSCLVAWLDNFKLKMDLHYDEMGKLADLFHVESTFKNLCVKFVGSLKKDLQNFNFVGAGVKIFALHGVLKLVRLVFKLTVGLVKTVYAGVRSILGFGEEEAKPVVLEPAQPQGNHVAVMQDEQVYDKIYANLYTAYMPKHNLVIGQILFVEHRLAVMPLHYIDQITSKLSGEISEGDEIVLYDGAQKYGKIKMTVKQFLAVPRFVDCSGVLGDDAVDVVFLNFDARSNMSAKAKITNHFVSESNYSDVAKAVLPARLSVTRIAPSGDHVYLQKQDFFWPVIKKQTNMHVGKKFLPLLWATGMTTRVGDCGGPLMISRRDSCPQGRCILGIHVAGNSCPVQPKAYAAPVTYESILRAKAALKVCSDNFEEDMAAKGIGFAPVSEPESIVLTQSGLVAGSFEVLGVVDKPVAMAPRTRIAMTPLHAEEPFGPSGLARAHLRPILVNGELKFPMVEGLKNYQTPLEWRDIPDLDLIVAVATKRFREASVHDSREILSFEESVKSPLLMKLKAVNRATSAGYPFVLDGQRGKTLYFGKGEEYDLDGEECLRLRARCEHIINEAKRGVRLAHICVDFLKDEVRPQAKVDACATRVISGSPLDYVISFRQYFGSFMAAMFRNHTVSGFTPGINPYQEWWQLADELTNAGKHFFDGDFSRFDASEQPYILWAILKFINEWYDDGEENARVREVLFMDLVHSRHLSSPSGPLKYVIQWNKSLPSGHPLTTPVNSLYAMIALVLCYARLSGNPIDFWDHCYAATNGDDNISGVDDERKDVYNQVTVAQAMELYLGLKYTSGSKDGLLQPFKPLSELTFLKRRFLRDENNELARGGWLAPLDLQSFLYSAYFTKAKQNVAADIANNLEFALGELSLHEPEVWSKYAPEIFACLERYEYAPKYGRSRDAYRQYMSSKTDFWY